jgi:protein-S-isoprenylcysteine O-methyltransferase Ste14
MKRIAVPTLLIPAVVFALYRFLPASKDAPWSPLRIAGAILAALSYVLVITARIQLGNSFSVRPEAKELVTHGLYARLRNPMYVFVDLMILGLILVLDLHWLLLVFVPFVGFQAFQAHREAKVLREKFGSVYLDYRQQTWF